MNTPITPVEKADLPDVYIVSAFEPVTGNTCGADWAWVRDGLYA